MKRVFFVVSVIVGLVYYREPIGDKNQRRPTKIKTKQRWCDGRLWSPSRRVVKLLFFFFICFWEAVAAERGGPTDDQAIHLGTITIKMEIEEEKEG